MNVYENQAVLEGRRASSLSVSGTAASVLINQPGVYAVWSDVDTKISVDVDETRAETVTTSDGFPITADSPVVPIRITRPSYLAGIAESNGTLYYHQIS